MDHPPRHLVIMGVAGSGKSTTATLLSEHLGWIAAEADEFHPAANIARMTAGIPLTDEDRWPWLEAIAGWMSTQALNGRCTIVTCSALKKTYRNLLSDAAGQVQFVHLSGDAAVLATRMGSRRGHFMPASLLQSQLDALEPLEPDENGITVDLMKTPAEINTEILERLLLPAS